MGWVTPMASFKEMTILKQPYRLAGTKLMHAYIGVPCSPCSRLYFQLRKQVDNVRMPTSMASTRMGIMHVWGLVISKAPLLGNKILCALPKQEHWRWPNCNKVNKAF